MKDRATIATIATIVFCDIVGFTEHSHEKQISMIDALNMTVASQLHFPCSITMNSPIIILPTGDGMAIAFIRHEEGSMSSTLFPLIQHLMQLSTHTAPLRVGVHIGPISVIREINGRPNICGTAVNECQRIMAAAHPGQILISATAKLHYIGHGKAQLTDAPFSNADPAQFFGPHTITSKHGLTNQVFVMAREGKEWEKAPPITSSAIEGFEERAEFIVKQLSSLMGTTDPVVLYEQAAFTSFGISDQFIKQESQRVSIRYGELLREQRRLFSELAAQPRTKLRMIINPERMYDANHRLESLLHRISQDDLRLNPNFDIVYSDTFLGPNRIIVGTTFSIEGYKLLKTDGFAMSIVHHDQKTVKDAIAKFDAIFTEAQERGQGKNTVIALLENLLARQQPDA
jgi:hypothetical protein